LGLGRCWKFLEHPFQVALTCSQQERATQVATPPLPAAAPWGVTWGFLAKIPMAAPQGPVCKIRLLIVHRYQPGIKKSGAVPCTVEHFGRRGKPVKKMRLIPAEKAFAFARKFQGLPGVTVSVV